MTDSDQKLVVFWTMSTDRVKTEAFALSNPDIVLYLVPPDGSRITPLRSTSPANPLAAGCVFVSAGVPELQLRKLLGANYPDIIYQRGPDNRVHKPVRALRTGSVYAAIERGRETLRADGQRLFVKTLRAKWQSVVESRRSTIQPTFIPRAFRG